MEALETLKLELAWVQRDMASATSLLAARESTPQGRPTGRGDIGRAIRAARRQLDQCQVALDDLVVLVAAMPDRAVVVHLRAILADVRSRIATAKEQLFLCLQP